MAVVAAGIVQLFVLTFVLTFVLIFVLTFAATFGLIFGLIFGAFGRRRQMQLPIWMSSADDEMAAAVAMAAA